jgi:hypothetical protein
MDIPDLMERLERTAEKMADDYTNNREGIYPPLY